MSGGRSSPRRHQVEEEVRHGASHQRGDDRVGDEAFVAEVALG